MIINDERNEVNVIDESVVLHASNLFMCIKIFLEKIMSKIETMRCKI